MSTVIRVVMLSSFLLGSSTWQLFAAPRGGSGSPRGSHYERPSTASGPFKERVIVFVHGIFGDADRSWTSANGVYWPKLLLEDSAFNDSDVYMAQYDSPARGNTLTVTEVVAQLNNRLTADGVFEKHHEVVFVCHSLGGIIVQQLLLTFREDGKQVPFIYFFAVPEEGAQIAKFGSLFDSDPLLQALFYGDENEYLLRLENDWRAAHFTIKRYCAYEKKAVKGTILIVDRLSGTRNCDAPPIPINEDHVGIVKPNGTKHDSYIALRNATKENPISRKPSIGRPRKKTEVPSAPAPPFITIQISPSSLPIYVQPRSVTSVLQLHPYIRPTYSQDGLLKIANDTVGEGCWPSKEAMDSQGPNDHETLYRIEIGNHSQRTIASGNVKFGLKYNAALKGGGCTPPSSGQADQEDVVLIPPLDPGKSFEFYAVNQSNLCVWLIPPDSATVTIVGDDKESQIPLAFDKSPLYAAGAPSFPSTAIKWEGVPIKAGGYGIVRTGARSCEINPTKLARPGFTAPETSDPKSRANERELVLSVEWHTGVPLATFPPEGRISLLQLWPLPVENGGGGLAEMSGKPGGALGWPTQGNFVHECRLTNYSDVPLFNVRIALHLVFRKLVKNAQQPGSVISGDVSLSRDWLITAQKVDIGPDHSFTFYISNSSDQFVDVSFPESGTAQFVGDAQRRTIKLMRPEGFMSTLPPFVEPKPR